MQSLAAFIYIVFALTTGLAVFIFSKASKRPVLSVVTILLWLALQGCVSLTGFYTVTDDMPPRFALLVLPPFLLIVALFFTAGGRRYIDSLDPGILTLLHIVRIPVELVLFWLFLNRAVPRLMTFEGRNFDILAGLTAPIVFYFGFVRKRLSRKFILFWNAICLALLINIVINAALSAPFPFQQFAFSQPNTAVLYFPFVWLPCCIVPLALFAHLATIRKIGRAK